jgi:hypothetical protein
MSNTGPKSRLTDATEWAIRVEMSALPTNQELTENRVLGIVRKDSSPLVTKLVTLSS